MFAAHNARAILALLIIMTIFYCIGLIDNGR